MQWSSAQSRLSLASGEIDIAGVTCRGIQSMDITDEVSADPMYGNAPTAIGAPVGTHKAEITMGTIPEEGDNLLQQLAAMGVVATRALASAGVTMSEPNGASPYLIQATNMKLLKVQAKLGEAGGQKGSTMEFTFACYDPVNWNGIQLVESQGGGLGGIIQALLSI
jgi:hypothetical protein